jgi:branched-chain amino acid transport system ATP-binding protein
MILEVEGLTVSFGGLIAVNDVSFGIEEGSITGLIGPNGSGKTTTFNLISGVMRPDAGRVWLASNTRGAPGAPPHPKPPPPGEREVAPLDPPGGRDVTPPLVSDPSHPGRRGLAAPSQRVNIAGWPPHRITAAGLARTYQISRIFGQMTVWENMMVGARRPPAEAAKQARELLERVNLYEKRDDRGADLSYGQAKLLEIVRSLMLDPHVLLLDEPFAGVNPTMAQSVLAQLRELHADGVTLLVIDHAMTIIMSLCERILVMDMGELIADGPPAQIQENERVLEAYFGRSAASTTP